MRYASLELLFVVHCGLVASKRDPPIPYTGRPGIILDSDVDSHSNPVSLSEFHSSPFSDLILVHKNSS